MLLESETFPGISCFIPFLVIPTKIAKSCNVFGNISLWKVPRQTNAYVSNKWPLKLSGAYLNTQGSSPSGTSFKRISDG
ncbi:hypothetical protein T08_2629 [Trichinella sp. T8]|nr:hypothetical protein T08_2629 [Trichinella sp. T8]